VQEQVWSLVGREAASKAQRQGIGIEEMLRGFDVLDGAPAAAKSRDTFASILDRDLLAAVRNCQSLASETRRMSCSRVSVVPASDPFHRFRSKDRQPGQSPRWACGLR